MSSRSDSHQSSQPQQEHQQQNHQHQPSQPADEVQPQTAHTGLFRAILLQGFAGSSDEEAIQQMGALLEHLLARREVPEPERALRSRLEALSADLVFWATYLATEIDTRRESAVDPEDWEIARAAGHVGAQLLVIRERLLGKIELPAERTAAPALLDEFVGCRETSLWPLTDPKEARAVRTVGAYLGMYARRVHQEEHDSTASPGRRDARAAVADLLHLSNFSRETSELASPELAERLVQLSRYLTAAARRLVEAERSGPDLGDLLE